MWIYEQKAWPNFTWQSERLVSRLAFVRHSQGRLLGRMESLGFNLRREANLVTLTNDILKSSSIEGEILNTDEVRSSIASRLGIEVAGITSTNREVEGIVEMMLDATQHFTKPLTRKRLFSWHSALFPTGRSGMHNITVGAWRGVDCGRMRVVSGPIGRERVHFEAPDADSLDKEMQLFLVYINQQDEIDPLLKAGLAHLWFVTIHPFEDGNGRIARAIADMLLARADGLSERFYSVSTQIEAQRKRYYDHLERQQRGNLDITDWLMWFLDCVGCAVACAEEALTAVISKAKLWEVLNAHLVNERQRLVINRMMDNFKGYMTTSKYAKLAKCSADTALRDIQSLVKWGVLVQNASGGRSTSYRFLN